MLDEINLLFRSYLSRLDLGAVDDARTVQSRSFGNLRLCQNLMLEKENTLSRNHTIRIQADYEEDNLRFVFQSQVLRRLVQPFCISHINISLENISELLSYEFYIEKINVNFIYESAFNKFLLAERSRPGDISNNIHRLGMKCKILQVNITSYDGPHIFFVKNINRLDYLPLYLIDGKITKLYLHPNGIDYVLDFIDLSQLTMIILAGRGDIRADLLVVLNRISNIQIFSCVQNAGRDYLIFYSGRKLDRHLSSRYSLDCKIILFKKETVKGLYIYSWLNLSTIDGKYQYFPQRILLKTRTDMMNSFLFHRPNHWIKLVYMRKIPREHRKYIHKNKFTKEVYLPESLSTHLRGSNVCELPFSDLS